MGLTGQLSEKVFEREGWDSMARTADHSSLAPSLIMEKGVCIQGTSLRSQRSRSEEPSRPRIRKANGHRKPATSQEQKSQSCNDLL